MPAMPITPDRLFPLSHRWLTAVLCCASLAALPLGAAPAPAPARNLQATGPEPSPLRLPPTAGQTQSLYQASYALVIGASKYTNGWNRLPGVPSDVTAITKLLKAQGFKVVELIDPTRDQLDATLRQFASQYGSDPGNRLLVYYAGHGHTLTNAAGAQMGYIVPVDAPNPGHDLPGFKQQAISMEQFQTLARQIDAKHALFVFDSCFSGSIFLSRDGAITPEITDKTAKPVRQFITAGDAKQTVPDESLFRRQLESAFYDRAADLNRDGYITGTELGLHLASKVTNYSNGQQTPKWGNLRDPALDKGDFVFALPTAAPTPTPAPRPGPSVRVSSEAEVEQEFWDAIKSSRDVQDFLDYLKRYPQGRYAALAQRQVRVLTPTPTPTPAPTPLPSGPIAGQRLQDCADCPELVVVPGGSFEMGSPASEPNRDSDEGPVHRVNVRSFALGRYEVTQGQWKAVMGSNPSRFKDCGDNCPVENVSWEEAQEYARKLSQKSGKSYRLPSEAEWEYAARAGTTTPFSTGQTISTAQANFDGNYTYNGSSKGENRQKTIQVGSFAANAFGLYDMHGNVCEWVQDVWHDNYSGAPSDGSAWLSGGDGARRVLRGGSWNFSPWILRSANRNWDSPGFRYDFVGFRIARTF